MDLKQSYMSERTTTMYGQFTFKSDYSMVCAGESFYTFLGTNSFYKVHELVFEEDKEQFINAVNNIESGNQRLVLRFKNLQDRYELFLFDMSLSKKTVDGDLYIDVDYTNLMYMKNRNAVLEQNIRKYRRLLAFERKSYFEYDIETCEFNIYSYVNDKSLSYVKCDLRQWYAETLSLSKMKEEDKYDVETFVLSLENATNDFLMTLPAYVFADANEHQEEAYVTVKGSILFLDGKKKYIVGTLTMNVEENDTLYTQHYISELKRDSSTGLYNKTALTEYVSECIANQSKKSIYFVVMDIDDFKRVNDTYGHMFGDVVIQKVADILKGVIRHRGIVGRFGGDEFVMVIENVDKEELRLILKTVSKNVYWAFKQSEKNLEITLSMGVSQYPEQAKTYSELFGIADKCLYLAKEKGKARFILYTPEKHGLFSIDGSGNVVGATSVISNDDKTVVISDIMLELARNGCKEMEEYLEKIRHIFEIDSISIYVGKNLKKTWSIGKIFEKVINFKDVVDDNYFELFQKDSIKNMNKLHYIQMDYPKAYEAYTRERVINSMQYYSNEPGDVEVFISYDVTEKNLKRSDHDVMLIKLFSTYIAKAISDEYNQKEDR